MGTVEAEASVSFASLRLKRRCFQIQVSHKVAEALWLERAL